MPESSASVDVDSRLVNEDGPDRRGNFGRGLRHQVGHSTRQGETPVMTELLSHRHYRPAIEAGQQLLVFADQAFPQPQILNVAPNVGECAGGTTGICVGGDR